MSLQISKISTSDSQALIARQLGGFFGDIALRRALAADHIRSTLYINASIATQHDGSPTVHTSRLLNPVRKTLDLLWPGTATEHLRDSASSGGIAQQTLDCLNQFGDIATTGGGYWLGTPLRLIRSSDTVLTTGAVPNAVLKALFKTSFICAGISRLGHVRDSDVLDQTISVSEWLGTSQEICSWTKSILSQHEKKMGSGNEVPADQLEFFVPEAISRTQRNPWIAAQAIAPNLKGPRLCRPIKTVAYVRDRPYYLVHFRPSAGQLLITRSVRVDYSLTRRLRFGLSTHYGSIAPITVTLNGDIAETELPVAVPEPETRIAALGWPLPSNPKRTSFHRMVIPFLAEAMGRLGVPVNTK